MKPNHFLYIFAFLLLPLLRFSAEALPQNFDKREGTLNPDGSITIRPGERIELYFGRENGRMTKPEKTEPGRGNIVITLSRDGGDSNYLCTTAIRDRLHIKSDIGRPISARCDYTTADSPRPRRAALTRDEHGLHRAFPKGITQATVSDLAIIKDAK
jgi:hypothetical protein